MIISRAPVRITLGGGGTDLPVYYEKFGSFLIAGAINKYVYLSANKRFENNIRLSYSQTEIIQTVDEIKHPIFRESFKLLGIGPGIEAVSIADIPANCGLGSSSAFTVALLNTLHHYKREYVSLEQLAEEACRIEIQILKEPIGKQDQYMSAFGGLTCLTIDFKGKVTVEPLAISPTQVQDLENRIVLLYTKIERRASEILQGQSEYLQKSHAPTLDALHRIKEIGLETRKILEEGNFDRLGELLNEHWQTKKKLSEKIADSFIENCYKEALRNGAIGGKIMGAGGGGFFMFYCPRNRESLIQRMQDLGLMWMPFHFEFKGAKVIANLAE